MTITRMQDLDLSHKRVLIREDLNVPIESGKITNDARLRAVLPTIRLAVGAGAKVMLMSHLGRPEEGKAISEQSQFSLAPVAEALQRLLECKVSLCQNYLDTSPHDWDAESPDQGSGENFGEFIPGQNGINLLENVRVNKGEKANDDELAKKYAELCDVFVMDAFGTAHRAQASTHGVARFAPVACAGPLLARELDALERSLSKPERPMLAIVGGAKVSTKLQVLESLAAKVDKLIVGGGIANTFLAAAGYGIGKSLVEADLVDSARELMEKTEIPLPVDVVVAKTFAADAEATVRDVSAIEEDEMILDIGPKTAQKFADIIATMKTIIWNGPVGVFEFEHFSAGTRAMAEAIANNDGFSIAGGGETVAAIEKFGVTDNISYISTGGGAFLEFVQGNTLPAVAVLESNNNT